MRFKVLWSLVLWLLLISSTLHARFHPNDSDVIDPEQEIGSEYYNDIFSYRLLPYWMDRYDKAQFGFLTSAGSLSVTRFLYEEYIKIKSSKTPQKFDFHFYQERYEGRLDELFYQEVIPPEP